MPGILNKQDLELDFQRCLQWLRTRTSVWAQSRSVSWKQPSASLPQHRGGTGLLRIPLSSPAHERHWSVFRNPLAHERAEDLSQSGKHSNFRCVYGFKNITHQKQQKCGWKMVAQKVRLIWHNFRWQKLHSMTSHFFSQLLFYMYHFTSFCYSSDTQPQACDISLVYKNMTVRRHQNCVLFPETGKD